MGCVRLHLFRNFGFGHGRDGEVSRGVVEEEPTGTELQILPYWLWL